MNQCDDRAAYEGDPEFFELLGRMVDEYRAGRLVDFQMLETLHPSAWIARLREAFAEEIDELRVIEHADPFPMEWLRSSGQQADSHDRSRAPSLPFERIGEFRLIRQLGSGGMSVVYVAEQESLHRNVALKLIPPARQGLSHAEERFAREAQVIASLDHPNIVKVFATGEERGIPYIAMELLEGCSLDRVVKHLGGKGPERLTGADLVDTLHVLCGSVPKPPKPPRSGMLESLRQQTWMGACLTLARSIGEALDHAHERGVIHRDVKPSNIFVTPEGRVLLVDFGIALVSTVSRLTLTGVPIGSLPYMSPEQIRGETKQIDRRSDIYSLGVTLYEMLTLRMPFWADTTEGIRRLILDSRPTSIRLLNRSISRDAETACLKAMDPEPSRRYPTAAELARDLGNVLEHRPVFAKPPSWLVRGRRWTQRHPTQTVSIVLSFLILVGSVGFGIHERLSSQSIARLSDRNLLRTLSDEAESFWPADEGNRRRMDDWLLRARMPYERLQGHAADLEHMRRSALPYTEADLKRDTATPKHEVAALKLELEGLLRFWETLSEEQRDLEGFERTAIEDAIAEREGRLRDRHTWRFEDPLDQWLHDGLTELLTEHAGFHATMKRVQAQRALIDQLVDRSRVEAREAWVAAIADIAASPVYRGLRIRPQFGLVPLWKSSHSGLWEFVHLPTGESPQRAPLATDADGLEVTAATGVVLVLLPGGTFAMGRDPAHDPEASLAEAPQHPVTLDPFFCSKYELTSSQWDRIRPKSTRIDGNPKPTDPAGVSWIDVDPSLRRVGLMLPTEAQWEYACRAGTTTRFFSGNDEVSLMGAANLLDRSFRLLNSSRKFEDLSAIAVDWDDGSPGSATVGSFVPNPFGLHDVHGNFLEWCQDWHVSRAYRTVIARPGDGLREVVRGGNDRVARGGSFRALVGVARSSSRSHFSPSNFRDTGARPVRRLDR
ncbi:MAG: bifunctional serine/threonine-protein kinase/formylglycine-generating enzyme family protein [Planctomycetota bacterium]